MIKETLQGFSRFIIDNDYGYDNFWVSDKTIGGKMIRDICTGEYGGITDTKGTSGFIVYDSRMSFDADKSRTSCSKMPASVRGSGNIYTLGVIDPDKAMNMILQIVALANTNSYRSYLPVGTRSVSFTPKQAELDTLTILIEDTDAENFSNVDFKVVRLSVDIAIKLSIDFCKKPLCN